LVEVLCRVEQALDEKDAALIRAVFASSVYVTDLVEDKNTSIRRLRQLLFWARTEKTDAVVGRRGEQREESPQRGVAAKTELAAGEADSGVSAEETTETATQGHGRNGADAYQGAERITVPHPSLHVSVCERALKKAILHRKNSLFYKTQNGACVGDLFMSLIYTCQLNQANPFDYLTQLQQHADQIVARPEVWMPWNYRAAMT
jgi:hypothetical protein